jgi:hypothetical protein
MMYDGILQQIYQNFISVFGFYLRRVSADLKNESIKCGL